MNYLSTRSYISIKLLVGNGKNVCKTFVTISPETRVTPSNRLFCQTNQFKTKRTCTYYDKWKEKQQILSFKKLEPASVWYFSVKNNELVVKIVADTFSPNQQIN